MEINMPAISEKIVAGLPVPAVGNKVHYFSGAQLQGKKAPAGFGVRCTASGAKSFVLFHRADGRKYLETLGRWDENTKGGNLSVRDAIVRADKFVKDIRNGRRDDPRPERTRRLQDGNKAAGLNISGLLDMFITRYVAGKLRSERTIRLSLDKLVKPRIGNIGIYDLKRSMVTHMLDEIADENGEVQADRVLSYIRKGFNWYEIHGHDDDFKSPIVRGMARTKPSEHTRNRILTDDELKAVWKATADSTGPFGPMLRFILLTACRRSEAAAMTRSEVVGTDWIIPAGRYKTKVEMVLPLSRAARDVLASIPKVKGVDYIFTPGRKPISGFARLKAKVDEGCGFSDWTIHDLRRTARSLMSRAGVPADHAERCLGHRIAGVRGIYDRHEYINEKRDAFEKLAAQITTILRSA
jgi:integrase